MLLLSRLSSDSGKLAEQLFLLIAQLGWRNDRYFHMLIALAVSAQTRNALAF
jgi:hypothetical protein